MRNELIVLAAAGAAVSFALVGAGVAGADQAPDVSGKKYSDANTALSKAGFTAVVATTVGDQVPQSDCLVTSQEIQPTVNWGPKKYGSSDAKNVLVSLNCTPSAAQAKAA